MELGPGKFGEGRGSEIFPDKLNTHHCPRDDEKWSPAVKALSVKLQKRDNDIYRAYGHIDFVISEVQTMLSDIDAVWD